MSFLSISRIVDEQEALEEFRHFDEDEDEKLSWDEFFKQEFNQTEDVIEQSRGKRDTEHVELIRVSFICSCLRLVSYCNAQ